MTSLPGPPNVVTPGCASIVTILPSQNLNGGTKIVATGVGRARWARAIDGWPAERPTSASIVAESSSMRFMSSLNPLNVVGQLGAWAGCVGPVPLTPIGCRRSSPPTGHVRPAGAGPDEPTTSGSAATFGRCGATPDTAPSASPHPRRSLTFRGPEEPHPDPSHREREDGALSPPRPEGTRHPAPDARHPAPGEGTRMA